MQRAGESWAGQLYKFQFRIPPCRLRNDTPSVSHPPRVSQQRSPASLSLSHNRSHSHRPTRLPFSEHTCHNSPPLSGCHSPPPPRTFSTASAPFMPARARRAPSSKVSHSTPATPSPAPSAAGHSYHAPRLSPGASRTSGWAPRATSAPHARSSRTSSTMCRSRPVRSGRRIGM